MFSPIIEVPPHDAFSSAKELRAQRGQAWVGALLHAGRDPALGGLVCAQGGGALGGGGGHTQACGTGPPVKGSLGKHPDSNPVPLLPGCVALGKKLNLSEPREDDKGPGDHSGYAIRS